MMEVVVSEVEEVLVLVLFQEAAQYRHIASGAIALHSLQTEYCPQGLEQFHIGHHLRGPILELVGK